MRQSIWIDFFKVPKSNIVADWVRPQCDVIEWAELNVASRLVSTFANSDFYIDGHDPRPGERHWGYCLSITKFPGIASSPFARYVSVQGRSGTRTHEKGTYLVYVLDFSHLLNLRI